MRELVRTRDGTCRMWGCTRAATHTDLDHVRPWPEGATTAGNLVALCRRHHRMKQRGRWRPTLRSRRHPHLDQHHRHDPHHRARSPRPRPGPRLGSVDMDMLMGDEIAAAGLTDWRKLAQGLHARYLVDDFGSGARFLAAVGEAGDAQGHHPSVAMGTGHVDLKLVTDDAIYRDDDGVEHVVQWPTQQDVDLARRITEIAAEHGLASDPASVSVIELGLDTSRPGPSPRCGPPC